MYLDISDQAFRNLVQLQLHLKEVTGKDFSTEEVFEYLLQTAINHVEKKVEVEAVEEF